MAIQPQAILFDLDNTLTNRRASIIAFARRFDQDFSSRYQVPHRHDIVSIMHDADDGGYRPLDERWEILRERIRWTEVPSVDELRDYWYQQLGYCAVGVEGLYNTLSKLRDKGIPLGIITNGPTGLQNLTTDTLHLRPYMDCVIVSETVGIKKPDPKIYEIALAEIKRSPHNVWFVGDNPATDLLGAHRMKMTTVWVRGHHQWTNGAFQPNHIVDNISEMLSLF